MTLIDAHIAVDLRGVAFLCAGCPEPEAFVVVSPGSEGWYGHCAVCGHSVFLGTHGTSWVQGQALTVLT